MKIQSITGIPRKIWGYAAALVSAIAALLAFGFFSSRKRLTRPSAKKLPDPEDVEIPDVDVESVKSDHFDDYERQKVGVGGSITEAIEDLNKSFD